MSGGFYKYRCKYFYSHNCTNWVWVNNAPCASCLAEGRDQTSYGLSPPRHNRKGFLSDSRARNGEIFFGVAPNILIGSTLTRKDPDA
ncbi:unnamed protein product [Clonostachys rhizophaga]|uniref:Uncharacterized protein n=1 Tax=Clonostachys rhizophaga TaxID=160324 RepID=A0A9N9VVI6_9HYPO|nr:unnamed protein product [Clonostachys rhizophaga]